MITIDVTNDAIPDTIRTIENWILWREGQRDGKPTKIPTKPYRTSGDINCDVTNPDHRRDFDTTWASFNDSRVTGDGLGFVFTDDVSITGVDLDKCRDPETGALEEWALDIIDRLDSYTEVSPSGTGVHILVGGELTAGGNRRGRVEMYDSDRYFTVTGAHLDETPTEIRTCQDDLDAVHRMYIRGETTSDGQQSLAETATTDTSDRGDNRGGRRPTEPAGRQSESALVERYGDAVRSIRDPAVKDALERVQTKHLPPVCPSTFDDLAGPGVELSDSKLLIRMYDSRGGERKRRLYEGDSSMWGSHDADYPSQSEADMALVHTLAFWTGKDPDRMDALFRNSGLMRVKWDDPHYASGATYGAVALARALLRVDDHYELPSEEGVKFSKADGPTTTATTTSDTDTGALSDDASSSTASQQSQEAAGSVGASAASDAVSPPTAGAPSVPGPLHTDDAADTAENAPDALLDADDDDENEQTDGDASGPVDGNGDASGAGVDAVADAPTGQSASTTTPDATGQSDAAPGGDVTPGGVEPAAPDGTDTDPDLDDSTQRMMTESVAKAGPEWSRTNPTLVEDEKHATDWTVGPIEGRSPTAQAMKVAREDNRVLARYQNRLEERLRRLQDVEEERDRYKFTAETYLKAMDELMGERERYRTQLRQAGLLSTADSDLPDDPVKRLEQILRPLIRREDPTTATETLIGLDAVLREYEEANEQIQADERERRMQTGFLSRFFRSNHR
ncbi:hypothetical protein EFA46_015420 (plasmid) [Halarchaeum sp. CBA1220]|uniref:phage NrS-1 polymerase family protein n=1 Tax=Halarchaeum sp. CBA1220 TaxID=1853682 RepID=UPI0011CD57A5|nr:hypothetical protein [Halarchaeum sp. CBA1220]QLC35648.1 hypothetical protein EFA46_015420 [Halarchaeum sp. CBA1220]